MHALAILHDCEDDVQEAMVLALIQIRAGFSDPKHWLQVYAVLNGETGKA